MKPRPKFLLEVKASSRVDVFSERERRINLSYEPRQKFPWRFLGSFLPFLILPVFVWGPVLAPVGGGTLAQTSEQERAALEDELEELEKQMQEYEATIAEYRRQGSSLQGEISILEAQIKKISTQIQAITLALQKLSGDIQITTSRIVDVEQEINVNKNALGILIRKVDENDKKGLVEILLENPELSDFFGSVNDLMVVQDSLNASLERLIELKGELITQKEILALEKSDVEALRAYQVQQRQAVDLTQSEKEELLRITKGNESTYQGLLSATAARAAQIRNRLFELLGGGQLSFGQAYELAKIAERTTGVRAALVLAVLDRESALGRNVGKCSYETAMHPTRDIPAFLQITKELGLDPESTQVSCPNADGVYGGAMGPAQFLPSTWMLYKNSIAAATGNRPPSPWRNQDAFVATGLYLRDAGATSSELMAAAKYYCGSNWQRWVCTNVYGQGVVDRAAQFEEDIEVLESA